MEGHRVELTRAVGDRRLRLPLFLGAQEPL
jgi:hypothetical protein